MTHFDDEDDEDDDNDEDDDKLTRTSPTGRLDVEFSPAASTATPLQHQRINQPRKKGSRERERKCESECDYEDGVELE